MNILIVVGARPQFIKLGPLSKIIKQNHNQIIIHTGQHYDKVMSELFFNQLDIPKPDINLGIGSGTHAIQTGKMIIGLEKEFQRLNPDIIICFGDTNTTLATCLTAVKLNIPTVHIEAGLRSFNKSMPEEINRIVADHTSDLLFAPTNISLNNLKNEGLHSKTILTGDIMVDSIEYVHNSIKHNPRHNEEYILFTLHRPYNVDNPKKLETVLNKLKTLNTKIIFPIHPRTKNIIDSNNIRISPNIELIEPLGYIEFQTLLKYANKVITDSGGIQKEAYIVGIPCITLRPETEWIETVESGWNTLLDIDDLSFIEKINSFSPDNTRYKYYGENVANKMLIEIEKFAGNTLNIL